VNNAGLFHLQAVEETSPLDFARTLETNLVAPFLFARAFLVPMRGRGSGHLVTIGSIADRVTFAENGAYAASKYGLRALHEVMRAELRGSGVRATLVSPGPVDTPLWDPVAPETRAGFTPRSAMLPPSAVADAILYAVTCPPSVNVDELRLTRS
jgi:NADP-dependent 3-hydroxy acid dehydrogenase YdfG